MKISIIVPVFNESSQIESFLDYLLPLVDFNFTKEIIVVDGGSTDLTIQKLKKYDTITVIHSPKGRAVQMNFGAKIATEEILYFLHCDSNPPKFFDKEIVKQVNNGFFSGCFRMKFNDNHIVLKVSEWFTRFNLKSFRGGDQSLFVVKELLQKLNGFNEEYQIYEDNELILRLFKTSKFAVIQKNIITSSRKYQEFGYWKLQFHFMMIHVIYRLSGYNHERIYNYYKKNIILNSINKNNK